jgi:hypothetical protein
MIVPKRSAIWMASCFNKAGQRNAQPYLKASSARPSNDRLERSRN